MGEIGLQVPLYSCAPGKAILAQLPEADFVDWLSGVTLKKFTATTCSSRAKLMADLTETAKRGYAIDRAEGLEGIHCIAAPILNDYGFPVAAITVMAPIFRLPESDFDAVGQFCIAAASQVRERLIS